MSGAVFALKPAERALKMLGVSEDFSRRSPKGRAAQGDEKANERPNLVPVENRRPESVAETQEHIHMTGAIALGPDQFRPDPGVCHTFVEQGVNISPQAFRFEFA